jgi:hypothetical protein
MGEDPFGNGLEALRFQRRGSRPDVSADARDEHTAPSVLRATRGLYVPQTSLANF